MHGRKYQFLYASINRGLFALVLFWAKLFFEKKINSSKRLKLALKTRTAANLGETGYWVFMFFFQISYNSFDYENVDVCTRVSWPYSILYMDWL